MIRQLQQILDEYTASNEDCGCQLVIYRNGELICDLCAGYLDHTRSKKVNPQTLFPVFSAGKSVLTTLLHIYAERGIIHYDAPVSAYWSEYACSGKEKTLVRDILAHRAALWDFPQELRYSDYYNWEKACHALEQMTPLGEIGGMHNYHAYTYGVLVGRLLEKAVGKPLRQMLSEMILEPLHIDGFFWGGEAVPEDNIAAIVPWVNPDGSTVPNDWLRINDLKYLKYGLNPSVNTLANARALAKVHAALSGSGVDGVRLLRDATLEQALQIQRTADAPVTKDQWDKFGLGYVLCGPEAPWNRIFGQAGACGAEGFADRETGYAVGLTRNQLNLTDPVYPLRDAVSHILGIPERVW